jgi:hypothetical protein
MALERFQIRFRDLQHGSHVVVLDLATTSPSASAEVFSSFL